MGAALENHCCGICCTISEKLAWDIDVFGDIQGPQRPPSFFGAVSRSSISSSRNATRRSCSRTNNTAKTAVKRRFANRNNDWQDNCLDEKIIQSDELEKSVAPEGLPNSSKISSLTRVGRRPNFIKINGLVKPPSHFFRRFPVLLSR